MTIDEMVAVMRHYQDGGEVQCTTIGDDRWLVESNPIWDFYRYEYRIKEKPKTKTVWFWNVRDSEGWLRPSRMYTEERLKKVYIDILEYKRMDILGSEEVPNA